MAARQQPPHFGAHEAPAADASGTSQARNSQTAYAGAARPRSARLGVYQSELEIGSLRGPLAGNQSRDRSSKCVLPARIDLLPNFQPIISRVRRSFRPSWGASFVVLFSCSSQFFRLPFTL
jgi:hypothetical protein